MAPSLVTLGAAALALVGDVAAKQFYLDDTYDYTNFFDKFNFFESRFGTGDYNDVDPSSGYVRYLNRLNATNLGLIAYQGEEIYMGVDHATTLDPAGPGRASVRIESKDLYTHGLIVARFTHLPKPVCGSWPAFWTFGDPWPTVGEIDIMEYWNLQDHNAPTFHTGSTEDYGLCTISNIGQSATVTTPNCDIKAPGQYENQGCSSVAGSNDPYGANSGGVYAVEWTADYIKIFSFKVGNVPANIDSDTPDTSTWGVPTVLLSNSACDVDSHFSNQKIVLNLDFCGVAGLNGIWDSCAAANNGDTCHEYVAGNPDEFNDVFFKIKDIRYFKDTKKTVTSTSTTVSSTSTSTSSTSSATSTTVSTTSTESSTTTSSTEVSSTSSAASSTSAESSSTSTAATSTETSTASPTESSTTCSETSTSTSASSTESTTTASSTETTTSAYTETSTSTTASSTELSTASSTASATETSTTASSTESSTASTTASATETSTTSSETETSTSASTTASSTESSTASTTASATETSTTSSETETSTTASAATSSTITSNTETSTTCTETETSTSTGHPTLTSVTSSTAVPPTSTSTEEELTTSTVYTTSVYTVTSCKPTVTNCPKGQVTTETIALYTTICPVSGKTTTTAQQPPKTTPASGPETSTATLTRTYTITSCPPSVPSCPVGKVTTELLTTTWCPDQTTTLTRTVSSTTTIKVPMTTGYNSTISKTTSSAKPQGTGSGACSGPNCPPPQGSGCTGPKCPPPVTVNGGVQIGASFALMAVGAVVVFFL